MTLAEAINFVGSVPLGSVVYALLTPVNGTWDRWRNKKGCR